MALRSILIATVVFLAAGGPAAAGWITEAVLPGGNVGSWSSLVVGSDDTVHISTSIDIDRFGWPHISYYDTTARYLRHALRQ